MTSSNGAILLGLLGIVTLVRSVWSLRDMFKTNSWIGYGAMHRVHRENHPKAFWLNAASIAVFGIFGAGLLVWAAILLRHN
jgi:hypothetical protein